MACELSCCCNSRQRLAEAADRDGHHDHAEDEQGGELGPKHFEAHAFQEDAADDHEHVVQRIDKATEALLNSVSPRCDIWACAVAFRGGETLPLD